MLRTTIRPTRRRWRSQGTDLSPALPGRGKGSGRGGARGALSAVASLLALLSLGAGMPSASAATTTPPGKAWVRAAHLVPGVGAVHVDLTPAGGGAASTVAMTPSASYGDVTSYQKVAPGTYTVNVRDATATAGAPMLSRSFTIRAGAAMTLAVLGTKSAPRLATLVDDLTPPAPGKVRVRVLPAAALTPEVSVAAVHGPMIATDAVLGQATDYAAVPAGRWDLRVTATGAQPVAAPVSLTSGSVYTIVVLDKAPGRSPLQVVTDAAGAMAAPKGGAQTGGGGTAARQGGYQGQPHAAARWSAAWWSAIVTLAVAALLTGFAARRLDLATVVRRGRRQ